MSKIITGVTGQVTSHSLGGILSEATVSINGSSAGYFRIGNVVLTIPPEQIQCHKVINGEEVTPLRFPFGIPVKTGQSRWDVTWSWKALADFDTQDYSQWMIVQQILAMFKAAPFVEVENEHIRQIVNPGTLTSGANVDDAMGFALRQMRVDTVPDMIDALQITMSMSLFNYRPYSKNFQYDTGAGVPASSAATSIAFSNYLNNWIQKNLNSDPTLQPETGNAVSTSEWQYEQPGQITLSCREYVACPLPYTPPLPLGGGTPTPANPGATQPGSAAQGGQSNFVDNVIISPINASNPQIQWWINAVLSGESAGSRGYLAVNTKTKTNSGAPSVAVGQLQWVAGSALQAMAASDKYCSTNYISTAVSNGYLIPSSSVTPPYTWNSNKSVPNPLSVTASAATYISWMQNPPSSVAGGGQTMQNNMSTAWAITLLNSNNGRVLSSWEAQYFGQGGVSSGKADPATQNTYFTKFVNSWRSSSGNAQAFAPAANTTPAPQPQAPAPNPSVTSGGNTNPSNYVSGANVNGSTTNGAPPVTYQIQNYLNQGWTYESFTNFAAFLYKVHSITMASSDSRFCTIPSCTDIKNIDPEHFIYPNQISVVFSNNIAQMPLASYQYPTYQHLGPVSTLVSIGMLSDAKIPAGTDTYPEPEHTGLRYISSMTDLLEEQYQRLRTEWRYVNAIQCMQAMSVKSQVLNLLGIRGLLTKELTTETIPDAPNLVSAQYNGIQYENVFEEIGGNDGYFVNTVPAQFAQIWNTILRNGTLNAYKSNTTINALTQLSALMQNETGPDAQAFLYNWLVGTPQPLSPAFTISTPIGFAFTGSQQLLMTKLLQEYGGTGSGIGSSISFQDQYPDIANMIYSHNVPTYTDYFIITNWVTTNANNGTPLPDGPNWLSNYVPGINAQITSALNAITPVPESPLDTLWDNYVAYAYSADKNSLQTQMQTAMTIPAINALFVTPTTTATPGSPQGTNLTHGCYRDLGITELQLNGKDYTPAVYFFDDAANIVSQQQDQITQIVNTTTKTAQALANATPLLNSKAYLPISSVNFTPNIQGILSIVKPAAYNMARAFPTFKLFLMEDNSVRPYFAYDKFYSYATVLDMEIIRYRDKPDTAIIKISNLMHLLDQKLFDTTPQGSQEQRLNGPIAVNLTNAGSQGGALSSGGGVGYQTINVDGYNIDNRFPQIAPSPGADSKFPLSYFALQTGTKIQIRMGFSNIPDNLTPVFTGMITDIEGDEILTITAQSYMLELVTQTPDAIRSDGFTLAGYVNQGYNALAKSVRDATSPGFPWRISEDLYNGIRAQTPAYGGGATIGGVSIPGITSPGGGAADVMSAMLHTSSAKHFGGWQWGATPNNFIKGWSWITTFGSVLTTIANSSITAGPTGLESGFDRSFENILTTHAFGTNGTASIDSNGSTRGWFYEKPAGYGAPDYYVPKDPTLTPWTLIQDISRRFPEFILAVKQYGFPYTADATLVFAHPNDFYSSRVPVPADIEQQQAALSNSQVFLNWWNNGTTSGKAQFTAFCEGQGSNWIGDTVNQYLKSINSGVGVNIQNELTGNVGANNVGVVADQLVSYITSASVFFTIVGMYSNSIGSFSLASSLSGIGVYGEITNLVGAPPPVSRVAAGQALEQVVQNYYNYYQQVTPANPSLSGTRMKPVRQHHMANADNIIHNGILLNEKFYNTVSLDSNVLQVSGTLAPNHIRLLTADHAVVSLKNTHTWLQGSNNYCQSFLRDEVAKMYRGEIVLLGNPDIEPFDILHLSDPSLGVIGPVEVDSVIHSFNQENGYITIVRPRAVIQINDALSMPIINMIQQMYTDVSSVIEGYASNIASAIAANASGSNGFPAQVGTGLGVAAAGTISAAAGLAAGATIDTGIVVGGIALGPWIAAAGVLAAASLFFWTSDQETKANPLMILPLARFERPWVGGIEGFRIANLWQVAQANVQYFLEDEIYPTLYSYRVAKKLLLNNPPAITKTP